MKKRSVVAIMGVLYFTGFVAGGAAYAAVKDWHDLHHIHEHCQQIIHEFERARAANHYDMAGHGARAEQMTRDVEKELRLAEDAARAESTR